MGAKEYQIQVTTSNKYLTGGTRNSVFVQVQGKDGNSTQVHVLTNWFWQKFKKGKTSSFTIKAEDVGPPFMLRIGLSDYNPGQLWACQSVVVKYKDEEIYFPVYDWIGHEMFLAPGKALTPSQNEDRALRAMRSSEVRKNKGYYQWIHYPGRNDVGWGLPRYVNATSVTQIPPVFRPPEDRTVTVLKTGFEAVLQSALDQMESFLYPLDTLESYRNLYKHLKGEDEDDPSFFLRWTSDEEFGYQQMNGISPLSFERCNKLPDVCQISGDHLRHVLPVGKSLEDEMKAGKIYISDYTEAFKGVARNKNGKGEDLYCPDAVCLYHVNDMDDLVPVAIQLVPDDPDSIFTSRDSFEEWLLAKMYFKVALGNMHEWYYHFLLTHDVMEPFAVSLFRCFPRSHPLYKLLRPHLQTVVVINTLARSSLIPKDSAANKALAIDGGDLARHGYSHFQLGDLELSEVLKKKGLDDPTLLPNYYYRDDALSLWKIIEKFVADVIGHYYSNDDDVVADKYIQDFVKDMAEEGLGWQGDGDKGMPLKIQDMQRLVRLCTSIIFTSSVQHAAVNFQQWHFYKFVPNCPLAMRLPPPTKGELIGFGNDALMKRIMDSLPNLAMATKSIVIAYTLSEYIPDEVYIGHYPDRLFDEPEIDVIMQNYQKALKEYEEAIHRRNSEVQYPYDWLLPGKIPNSIAI